MHLSHTTEKPQKDCLAIFADAPAFTGECPLEWALMRYFEGGGVFFVKKTSATLLRMPPITSSDSANSQTVTEITW